MFRWSLTAVEPFFVGKCEQFTWKWIVRAVLLNCWYIMLQFFAIVYFLKRVSHSRNSTHISTNTHTVGKNLRFTCKIKLYNQSKFFPPQNVFVFKWHTQTIKWTDIYCNTMLDGKHFSINQNDLCDLFCAPLHLLQIKYISMWYNLKCFYTQYSKVQVHTVYI